MATHDRSLIAALAEHIALARAVMVSDVESVAEAAGMAPVDVLEAVGWYQAVAEPRYRGSSVLEAASALATRQRHGGLVRPASERPDLVAGAGDKGSKPGALAGNHFDRKDLSRPERPCARCGNRFQPTVRRRMLCAHCYGDDDHGQRNEYLTRRDVAQFDRYGAQGDRAVTGPPARGA